MSTKPSTEPSAELSTERGRRLGNPANLPCCSGWPLRSNPGCAGPSWDSRAFITQGAACCSMFLTLDFPLSLAPSCPASDRTCEQRSLTAAPQLHSQAAGGTALPALPRHSRAPASSICVWITYTGHKTHTTHASQAEICYHHIYGKGDAAGTGHGLRKTPAPFVPERTDTMYSTPERSATTTRTPQHPPELGTSLTGCLFPSDLPAGTCRGATELPLWQVSQEEQTLLKSVLFASTVTI